MTSDNKILIGKIVAAHGIKGDVKIKSYTTIPSDLCSYYPILNKNNTPSFTTRSIYMNIKTINNIKANTR